MRDKILKILEEQGRNGILQEEFTRNFHISKSTVSTVLSTLEKEGKVVRKRVAGRSHMVWLTRYAPGPVNGLLRIGILNAIEYPGAILAAREIRGSQIYVYPDAFSLTRDLAEGYLDVSCSPLITQVLFALTQRSIKINAGCGYNGGGIVIRKRNPVIFGSTELSTMEFSLRRYMEHTGIKGAIRYFQNADSLLSALKRGMVDAIGIWEPYLTELESQMHTVRFSALFGDYPCCTLASNINSMERDIHKNFLERYRDAVEHLPERREEAIAAESEILNMDEDRIRKAFHGFKYSWKLDIDEAVKVLEYYGLKLTEESLARVFSLL
jgi:predicted transcriptional regulator